jgi:asparagine synthase (glutamine-hydrolysing)
MCGIAGILTLRDDLELGPLLSGMCQALGHRGPDDRGWETIDLPGGFRLGLAQTRLAILDLSAAGHQPMAVPDSHSWIAYNGEIYNHLEVRSQVPAEYRSQTDTETILRCWMAQGERVLQSLRGMFAFGLYDGLRRQFWLVRDRLGIKPLYVCRIDARTWVFASEVRAILATGLVSRCIDRRALNAYLALGAVPAPWTLVSGIQSLLPAERWRFDLDDPTRELAPERSRYWRPRLADAKSAVPDWQDAVGEVRRQLLDATRLHMLSDVPVGAFLSGGVDSTAVVAALTSQNCKVRTFSVGFRESRFDESHHARKIASRLGTEHSELIFEPCDVLREFTPALASYDQPSIDGLNTFFISQAVRRAGVTVALSGLGGDELFAGYPYFRHLQQTERPAVRLGARAAYQVLRRFSPGQIRTIKLGRLLDAGNNRLARWLACREVMLPGRRRELLGDFVSAGCDVLPSEIRQELEEETARLDPVNAQTLCEMSLYMSDMLLRDTDQMSMAHALEVRVPLLDHRLVETVLALPGSLKTRSNASAPLKRLLVEAIAPEVPPSLLNRPKQGFVLPWERWLRGALRQTVADRLHDRGAVAAAGLQFQAIEALWEQFTAGRPGVRASDILGLVNLLQWVRRHGMVAPTEECATLPGLEPSSVESNVYAIL